MNARDFFDVRVDPDRLVSQDFIDALRQAGAKESLIGAIEAENKRKRAKVKP